MRINYSSKVFFLRYRYFQILLCLSSKVVPRISQDFFSGFFKKFCNKFARSFSRGFLHEFAKKFLWGIWKNIHSENFSNNISKSLRIPRISRVISFRNFCENSSKDPKKIKRSSKYFSRSSSEYSSIFFFWKIRKCYNFFENCSSFSLEILSKIRPRIILKFVRRFLKRFFRKLSENYLRNSSENVVHKFLLRCILNFLARIFPNVIEFPFPSSKCFPRFISRILPEVLATNIFFIFFPKFLPRISL